MTKEYVVELSEFNIWANSIFQNYLNQITDEQWNMTIESSFNSIAATTLHIVGAEKIWLDRLQSTENPVWLPSIFSGNRQEMLEVWHDASLSLHHFVLNFDKEKLDDKLHFRRINGESHVLKFYQVFSHIFNHSTYHRGQLLTLLRQSGFVGVGPTDLMLFYQKQNLHLDK